MVQAPTAKVKNQSAGNRSVILPLSAEQIWHDLKDPERDMIAQAQIQSAAESPDTRAS